MMSFDMLDYIESLMEEAIEERRLGFYRAKFTGVLQSWRRVQVAPAWMPDSAANRMRRIASPLLDVTPPAGAWLAMIAEDGVPELSTVLGQIWDEHAPKMTAWIRAQLATQPGFLEIGATKGIRVRLVAEDPYSQEDVLSLDVLDEGVLQVEANGARITISASGEITLHPADGEVVKVGAGATQAAARADLVKSELEAIETVLGRLEVWAGAVGTALSLPYPPTTIPPTLVPGYVALDVDASKLKTE